MTLTAERSTPNVFKFRKSLVAERSAMVRVRFIAPMPRRDDGTRARGRGPTLLAAGTRKWVSEPPHRSCERKNPDPRPWQTPGRPLADRWQTLGPPRSSKPRAYLLLRPGGGVGDACGRPEVDRSGTDLGLRKRA
jgi:hypothetical protein